MTGMQIQERPAFGSSGYPVLLVGLAIMIFATWLFISSASAERGDGAVIALVLIAVGIFVLTGLFVVQPNETKVLTLFGKYVGTVRQDGLRWVNPLTSKRRVSLRVRNFQADRLKVNDAHGNPIEIAAVVVWRVTNAARASFDVENYEDFVKIQSETAIRTVATHYPYDTHEGSNISLRSHPDEIADGLRQELQHRLEIAGLEVLETRLSHLAYAPEIAQAMLRRQQAEAIISARQKIVDGAVGMVEIALRRLEDEGVVSLDEERKAAMVNNLLVALVSESNAQPVLNTGTLYA
jgi:regulator of protease activity HflC (stomatin/prohibitin superfamily)